MKKSWTFLFYRFQYNFIDMCVFDLKTSKMTEETNWDRL